jgi:hypothetical protein
VKAVFSSRFKADLDAEAEKYRAVSDRLASAFTERIAGQAREIASIFTANPSYCPRGGRISRVSLYMRGAIAILLSLFLIGCSNSDWDMVSKQDIPSPDGRHVATVFEMCPYNTTGYWPQLSLRRPTQKIGNTGNVLSCGPGGVLTAQWVSAHDLAVKFRIGEDWHPPSPTNIDGVTITFTHEDMR